MTKYKHVAIWYLEVEPVHKLFSVTYAKFFSLLKFICKGVCLHTCLGTMCIQWIQMPEEGVRSSETRIIDSRELSC